MEQQPTSSDLGSLNNKKKKWLGRRKLIDKFTNMGKDKKLIYRLIGLGVLLLFVFFTGWSLYPTFSSNEAKYCGSCHSMIPEYMTWKESGHYKFQCKSCHRQPGIANFFKYQVRTFKEVVFYRASNKPTVIEPQEMSSEVCKKCHSINRNVTPTFDTIVPHDRHERQGVGCLECHKGVVHGNIAEREVVKERPDPETWTPVFAREQLEHRFVAPLMSLCLDCHTKRKVTTTCSVCHSRIPIPGSHQAPDWKTNHGQDAFKDIKPCNLCHSYTLKKTVDMLAMTPKTYVQQNSFCYNCHQNKPPSHKVAGGWMPVHGSQAIKKGTQGCYVCHDIRRPDGKQGVGRDNKTYCNNCHYFNSSPFR